MRNNITLFLLGIFLVILTSATTVSIMTVKPAIPKVLLISNVRVKYLNSFIIENTKKGYVLKNAFPNENNIWYVVIMEKY